MDSKSRIAKSQYNLVYSLINNFIVTILGFVTRSVFLYSLGVNYLGLNGLFTNVLSLLSLAELGVGSAITFSLYKPIAENDQRKIKALMCLYKSVYRIIGWSILFLGICITPALQYIVNLEANVEINYYAIYFIFLGNTVISYWFFAYRSVIVYANQEGYILTKIETKFALIRSILQFVVLLLFRNYYIYLLLPIIAGVVKNVVISNVAGKKYPIINEKGKEPLSKEESKAIFKNVFALTLFKVSGVVYSSTDNIVISTWLGTKVVGLLSNYTMITQMISSYINMFFQALYASVGNLNATEGKEYKYVVFKRLQLLNFWIYCYCTICLGCFLNPCIKVWLGSEYCLEQSTIFLLALVFLIPGLNNVINIFKDACGLFKEVQYRALATAVVNLVASIILVIWLGIDGVFLGTIIAYLTTIYQIDPRVVYKKVFALPTGIFYKDLLKKFMLFAVLFSISTAFIKVFQINSWLVLFAAFFVLSVGVNILLWAIYRKSEEFEYLKKIARNTISRFLHRGKQRGNL